MDFNSARDGMSILLLLLIAAMGDDRDDVDDTDDDGPWWEWLVPSKVYRSVCSACRRMGEAWRRIHWAIAVF